VHEELHEGEGAVPDEPTSAPEPSALNTTFQAVIAIGGLILFAGFAFSVCQSMPG